MQRAGRKYSAIWAAGLALATLAVRGSAGGAPPEARPEARAGDLLVFVNRVQRFQQVSRQFTRDGPVDSSGLFGMARCSISVGFGGSHPGDGYRVLSLTPTGDVFDDRGEMVSILAQPVNGPEGGGSVTTTLVVPDVSSRARYLRAIEGEISAYAHADLVRVEVPWPSDPEDKPRAARQGVIVSLEEARADESGLTLRVRVDHPENASMSWNFGPRGGPIILLNRRGEPLGAGRVQFMGGSSTGRYRIYHLQYQGSREIPARVAAEVLVRSGAITTVPFRLERIPLPDLDMPAAGVRADGDPFLSEASRAALDSQVLVGGAPAGAGVLEMGLRTASDSTGGANARPLVSGWRWYAVPTDARGFGRLNGLRPGIYQVRRYWRPAPGQKLPLRDPFDWQNALLEATVGQAQRVALPALTAPAAPRGRAE